jgi:hypothetical protein
VTAISESTTRVPAEPPAGRLTGLRRAGFAAFVMLVLQFGLGSYVNLYVEVPGADHGAGFGKIIASGPVSLTLHAVLGLLLILAAIGLLVQAALARMAWIVAIAAVGLLAVAGAAFSGVSFASQGHDSSSLAMALLTGVALLCYETALFLLPRGPRAAAQRTHR